MKTLAVMVPCPGIVNEGTYGHGMRDACWSCAPFWAQIPTCPTHHTKLTKTLYCKECKKHYGKPADLDLSEYRNG